MSVRLEPHLVRFSPGYERSGSAQHQDVVQIGTASAGAELVFCYACGEDIDSSLALVHRGRSLRGGTFEKAYHAWHILDGLLSGRTDLGPGWPHGVPS